MVLIPSGGRPALDRTGLGIVIPRAPVPPPPEPPVGGQPDGPCLWPVDMSCSPSWSSYPPDVQDRAERIAIDWLWALTGRRFGTCLYALRPCRRDCRDAPAAFAYSAGRGDFPIGGTVELGGGAWYSCGRCRGDGCSCTGMREITLTGPVAYIDRVRVDGETLPSSAYRVDGRRLLVRTDGGDWPVCQDMTAPATDPGTWEVQYGLGEPVPLAGQVAAGWLAVEVAKQCTGARDCALPTNVTGVQRQGVNQTLTAGDYLALGRTGIPRVDNWVVSVNPYQQREPSRVYSVDLPRGRQTTWRA